MFSKLYVSIPFNEDDDVVVVICIRLAKEGIFSSDDPHGITRSTMRFKKRPSTYEPNSSNSIIKPIPV